MAAVASNTKPKVIVVGGGLAGLMTTIQVTEAGVPVELFSFVPVKRSHSVCAQGGINGAVNTKGEGDSPYEHLDDTVYGGDFLANQPPVKHMCDHAPGIIYLLDRMGVMFNRTGEGLLDFRRFGGTKHHRTAYAGATTGQQLLYALDEQVRRAEADGKVTKYEYWEFLGIIRDDDGVCKGIVAQDLRSMQIKEFRADAVVLATGGPGIVYNRSTNSVMNTGTAASAVYQQGARYANGEFIQVHPTAIPGLDKLRLMSESARGEGGRVWVPRQVGDKRRGEDIPESERWYFLEEKYPAYGNLVPRDIATREIFDVCVHQKMGVHGQNQVYLDLTHLDKRQIDIKLGGILEIYEKFIGEDPRTTPMRIFPAVHYSMGGLWVGFVKDDKSGGVVEGDPRNQMTSIPGLYAVGECDYQYHGANRLGANSLLSCLTGGQLTGPGVVNYVRHLDRGVDDLPSSLFERERRRQEEKYARLAASTGEENPYRLHEELGDVMTDNVTVVRYNDRLKATDAKICELMERAERVGIADSSQWTNQLIPFTRQLKNMLQLARVITLGALARDESRGAHYKPDFPRRDDARFLKTTIAEWTPNGPCLSYEAVDVSLIRPRLRNYAAEKNEAAAAAPTANGKARADGAANLGDGADGVYSPAEQIAAGANPASPGDGGDQLSTRPPTARRDAPTSAGDKEEIKQADENWAAPSASSPSPDPAVAAGTDPDALSAKKTYKE
ncbi:MAG: succinate dehydrogenase flavoprotein subunit [Armatimonadetes bacterium]|nr:succinate dehydrogenase flavoprotein subunit [Armatimonadota bacterium]